MKLYHHFLIVTVLVILTILLYDEGFGAIPFLLAAIYLGYICMKEIMYYKKSKRMQHIQGSIVYNDKYAYVQRKDVRYLNIHEMTKQQLAEESMINIVFAILTEKREPLTLQQLMDEVRKLTGVSEKEMKTRLQQFYTDMNIDGRFIAINDNRWGLREWYPVDQIEVETAPVVKVRKKKKKKAVIEDDDEEDDDDEEEEDELFDEEFDELLDEDDDDEEEEEEVVEIEADLLDPDDDLEIIPDDADIDLDDEDEEDDEEEEEEIEE